jgi:hypothetical protein
MKRTPTALVAAAALLLPATAEADPPLKPILDDLGGPHRDVLQREPRLSFRERVVRPYRSWLRSTRLCESHGNYRTNTGNGFYGAYQFTLQSWAAVGGRGLPHLAARLEQDYRAVKLLRLQGPGAWPVCG